MRNKDDEKQFLSVLFKGTVIFFFPVLIISVGYNLSVIVYKILDKISFHTIGRFIEYIAGLFKPFGYASQLSEGRDILPLIFYLPARFIFIYFIALLSVLLILIVVKYGNFKNLMKKIEDFFD